MYAYAPGDLPRIGHDERGLQRIQIEVDFEQRVRAARRDLQRMAGRVGPDGISPEVCLRRRVLDRGPGEQIGYVRAIRGLHRETRSESREGRARIDRERQPIDLEKEVRRSRVVPHDDDLESRGIGDDRHRIADRGHRRRRDEVHAKDPATVDHAGRVGYRHQLRLVGLAIAAKRRIAYDDIRHDGVLDADRAARTEVGADAGGSGLFDTGHEARDEQQRTEKAPHRSSVSFVNASGNSCASVQRRSSWGPTAITSRCKPNSASSCRHAPHGAAGGSTSVVTTMRVSCRAPATTAAPNAMRSAQIVSPYDALSTLQPTYTFWSAASSA